MKELIHIDDLCNRCGFFTSDTRVNGAYGCNHKDCGDGFIDSLNQYVYENHYDDKIDDISKDWQLPRRELVKKVLDELKKEK